jgi:hypothetical protein
MNAVLRKNSSTTCHSITRIITCLHGSARQIVIGHVRFKGKVQKSTPHSSQTDKPKYTKLGIYDLCPDLTPCAKVGLGRLMRGGATKPQIYIDLRGFRHFFFFLLQTQHLPEGVLR